jgi:hypothetical protein
VRKHLILDNGQSVQVPQLHEQQQQTSSKVTRGLRTDNLPNLPIESAWPRTRRGAASAWERHSPASTAGMAKVSEQCIPYWI